MRRCSVATRLFSAADRTQTKAARRRPDQRLHPEACLYFQLTRELCSFDRPISPDRPKPPPNSLKNGTLSFIPACTHRQSYYWRLTTTHMTSQPDLMIDNLIIHLISHWSAASFRYAVVLPVGKAMKEHRSISSAAFKFGLHEFLNLRNKSEARAAGQLSR